MELLPESKILTKKLTEFIKSKTPTGQTKPPGLGWTLWDEFHFNLVDAKIFLSDEGFERYMHNLCGTRYARKAIILNALRDFPALSDIVFAVSKKSKLHEFKVTIVKEGLYEGSLDSKKFLYGDDDAAVAFIRISDAEVAKTFIKNISEKIRLEAYYKIGVIECAEMMAKDKSVSIRSVIANSLPYGHDALKIMMDDRSKYVYGTVLRKIDKQHIPMMLGSHHLKEKFVKLILDKRLESWGENEI